jgi:acylphosphatase
VADETHTRRFFVSGRVQGVGFRMFALREAQKLRVTGYTRNLFDGRVEVFAHGTAAQLAELKSALQRGPLFASVSEVQEQPAEPELRYRHRFVVEPDA